jgi:hypothetical protein
MSDIFPPGLHTGSTGQVSMSVPPSYSAHPSIFLTVFVIFIIAVYIYITARFMMAKQRKKGEKKNE